MLYPTIDEAREELRKAEAEFRSVGFSVWTRRRELDLEDARSAVGFWRRKLHDALEEQRVRDAQLAKAESIDNGLESDDSGNYFN